MYIEILLWLKQRNDYPKLTTPRTYNVSNENKHFNENILELVLNCLFFSLTEFEWQQILFSELTGSHQTMELSHILRV